MDLATIYASGSIDPWHCLSLVHPALPDGQVNWVLRFMESLAARLETGEWVEFEPAWFDLALPKKGAVGQQRLELTISNVAGQVRRHVEDIRAAGGELQVIYRAYVPGQLNAPAEVLRLTATHVATKGLGATITAMFREAINVRWPRRIYTLEEFPGLAYIGG